ncbi:MAG: metalloregulator ArsR/SmtB family transcription factor [Acidimicrobiales bacterium]
MDDAQARFAALADPTRRQILRLLSHGDVGAGELAQQFEMSWPAVSRHLHVLKSAGLVVSRRVARHIVYSPNPEALRAVTDELGQLTGPDDAGAAGPASRQGVRFNAQAMEGLRAAPDIARALGHDRVGTHHLLLAMLAVKEGSAARVAQRFGVTEARAREALIAAFGQGEPKGPIPFEWDTKSLLAGAVIAEAIRLGRRWVGTGEFLLALVRETVGVDGGARRELGKAAGLLAGMQVDLRALEDALVDELVAETDGLPTELAPVLQQLAATHELAWSSFVGLERRLERLSQQINELATVGGPPANR